MLNTSAAQEYTIFNHAPAPAVPPAISNLSSVGVFPHLNENIYLPAAPVFSSSNQVCHNLPAQFALIPVEGAPVLAVVGDIVVHVFADLLYLYIVTAALPSKYI